ncbi:hypothetical protein WH50_14440 [Pokkaliibacter plantistimulans]|uniref:Uncharacterized protein n=1 Tax=Pokkaliibacter plantistimulans TaxID=1635171 RepID=A0ABX5LWC2_9GAMM|nr:hypothetical protein [Pokkaliibacter plantistimulans]PXF30631.1 hypothetical protein WH50_14440 [Pokkaliibacter plantistimulans]
MLQLTPRFLQLGRISTLWELGMLEMASKHIVQQPCGEASFPLHCCPQVHGYSSAQRLLSLAEELAAHLPQVQRQGDAPVLLYLPCHPLHPHASSRERQQAYLRYLGLNWLSYQPQVFVYPFGRMAWWASWPQLRALLKQHERVLLVALDSPAPTVAEQRQSPASLYCEGALIIEVQKARRGLQPHWHSLNALGYQPATQECGSAIGNLHDSLATMIRQTGGQQIEMFMPSRLPASVPQSVRQAWNIGYHTLLPLLTERSRYADPLSQLGECGTLAPLAVLLYLVSQWQNAPACSQQPLAVQLDMTQRMATERLRWCAAAVWGWQNDV